MKLTESLNKDLVRDLRPRKALTTGPESTVRQTIGSMQESNEGCVVVCDGAGTPCGIFTERDLLQRVIGEGRSWDAPIREVMSTELATVKETEPITRAFSLLHERGLRHLPVIDDNGQLRGVVSVRRVLEYLVEHFPQEVYNLPPDPSVVSESREGA